MVALHRNVLGLDTLIFRLLGAVTILFWAAIAQAQDSLEFMTIERKPFSFNETVNGQDVLTGFSIDLIEALAEELGQEVRFTLADNFNDLLDPVKAGEVDGAIANISITAEREAVMDFSQPIFGSGIQILIDKDAASVSLLTTLLSPNLLKGVLLAIFGAFGLLFAGGMLMWSFERKRQEYFDRSIKDALFPSFWWALILVVNGGFEERMPRSNFGRVLAVLLVISSLFIVSVFVANLTSLLTLNALQSSINSISDLDGKEVATTTGSSSSAFLELRDINHETKDSFQELMTAFENGDVDAVVFDAPLLAYHIKNTPDSRGRLLDRVFKPEDYGIALVENSELREPINRGLLKLRESGAYDALYNKWFDN